MIHSALTVLAVAFLLLSAAAARPVVADDCPKLTGTQFEEFFGSFVEVDGATMAVGATGYNSAAGAVHLYEFDGLNWVFEVTLAPTDADLGDGFGYSPVINGDVMIIGAPFDDEGGSDAGAAYIFRKVGGAWVQEDKLLSNDIAANDRFGRRVAIDGDVAVIGAWFDDDAGSVSGSAYVFRYDGVDAWVQEDKLTANDAAGGDRFGDAVAIQGDMIVVGAYLEDEAATDAGAAYVFEYDGIGDWVQVGDKLMASDADPDDEFGRSISISGDTMMIGARKQGVLNQDFGAVYVYTWDGVQWNEHQRLNASDEGIGHLFYVVSLDGDRAVIGTEGNDAAYLFESNAGVWSETRVLSDATSDGFGVAVALDGDNVVVGANLDDTINMDAGAVYIIDRDSTIDVMPGESIQDAIDSACPGDEIVVHPGTYSESIDFRGKSITVRSTDPSDEAVVATTVIDGNGALHVVQCVSGEGPNTVIDGLTITGGSAIGDSFPDNSGGGLLIIDTAPKVRRCIVTANQASFGGGLYKGGNSGIPVVTDCRFVANTSLSRGGGVYDDYFLRLRNCVFSGNHAGFLGGAIFCSDNGFTEAFNCSFFSNCGDSGGSIIYVDLPGNGWLRNCVAWQSGISVNAATYSSNIASADPLFVDANGPDDIPGTPDDNLRLAIGSPSINAGNNSHLPEDLNLDLAGNLRIIADIVDQGAFELQLDVEGDLDQREVEVLLPEGDFDRACYSVAKVMNNSGGENASVSAAVVESNLHADGTGLAVLERALSVETSLATGTFWLQPTMPFTQQDLDDAGLASPFDLDLVEYDPITDAWILAGDLNADPLGTRHEVTDTTSPAPPPPGGIGTYGDYGVFWNPTLGKGYVWANLDHVGDFAVGYTPCPADLIVNGTVDVQDLLALLAVWGPCPAPCPPTCAADTNGDCTVDVQDLLTLLAAWGACN